MVEIEIELDNVVNPIVDDIVLLLLVEIVVEELRVVFIQVRVVAL